MNPVPPPNPIPLWVSLVGPALGGTIGSLLALLGVFLGNRLGADRESRLKSIEASHRRRERWEEFEGETLLAFQDKIAELVHVIAKMNTTALVAGNYSSGHGMTLEQSLVLHTEWISTHTQAYMYLTRIHDDTIRNLGVRFIAASLAARDACFGLAPGGAPQKFGDGVAIKEAGQAIQDASRLVADQIGLRIREKIEAERSKFNPEAK